ncbi:hypothetical protein AA313_de0203046 [Arthrobotrys entomopaga]|nr:hypothetical protein AA313_de0203046 [Arthrobotrys entomopaga]
MSGHYGYDYLQDPRYADYGHGYNQNGTAQGYYTANLELDDEPSFHPPTHDQGHFPFPGGDLTLGSISGDGSTTQGSYILYDSANPSSRGISTNPTHPDDIEDPYFVPHGPRCIFHWHPIRCGKKFHEHEDWQEHVESHFPRSRHANQPDLGDIPRYWNCGLRGCNMAITNAYSNRELWDRKMQHMFDHLRNDKVIPEMMPEDANWMKYYVSRGFCSPDEASGFAKYPPSQGPYVNAYQEFRRLKRLRDKSVSRDAPGELAAPAFGAQAAYPQYQPPYQGGPPPPPPPPSGYNYPPYQHP